MWSGDSTHVVELAAEQVSDGSSIGKVHDD
jgi:hypothetical protein